MEIWKDIEGYEGLYQISNIGRVKSLKYGKERILTINVNKKRWNYNYICLYKNGARRNFLLHRLVALTFIPNNEFKPEINHIDGNKFNNRVENLEWCTRVENIQHGIKSKLIHQCISNGPKNFKLIGQYKDNVLIQTFKGTNEAKSILGYTINYYLTGKKKQIPYKGFTYKHI